MAIGVQYVLDKAIELHRQISSLGTSIESLERQFERLVRSNDDFVERASSQIDDLRTRVAELEGLVNASLKDSLRVALESAITAHLEKHGTLPRGGDVVALLQSSQSDSDKDRDEEPG